MILLPWLAAAAFFTAHASDVHTEPPPGDAPPPGLSDAPPPGLSDAPPPGLSDAPPPGLADQAPPGLVDTKKGGDKGFNALLQRRVMAQDHPQEFAAAEAANSAAYNKVFGPNTYEAMVNFEKKCDPQIGCSAHALLATGEMFRGAQNFATLETGTLDHASSEYKARHEQIKTTLRDPMEEMRPGKDAPSAYVKDFIDVSHPLVTKIFSPEELQNYSKKTAEQTDATPAYNNLGQVFNQTGDPAKAREVYNTVLQRDPRNADALAGRSAASYSLGDYPSAAKDAATALDLNPQNAAARDMLLLSERRLPQGTWPELHNDLARTSAGAGVAALTPGMPGDSAVAGAGGSAVSGATGAGAPSLAVGGPANDAARRAESFNADARKAVLMGDAKSAVAAAQKSLELNPRNAEAYSLAAIAYGRLNDYAAAAAAARKGLELAPNNRVLLDTLSYSLNKVKDYKGALAAADRALRSNPRDALAQFNRAFALAGLGDRKGALDSLRAAAQLDKKFEPALNASIQMPENSDLLLLFSDDKAAGQASLLGLAKTSEEDEDKMIFRGEVLVGFLMVLCVGVAIKRFVIDRPA